MMDESVSAVLRVQQCTTIGRKICYNSRMKTTEKKRESSQAEVFSPAEQRAARSERIRVVEAEPYGWMAFSESEDANLYRLYRDPASNHLACTCGDFVFRCNAEPGYECKHVVATLKFIARQYLASEYDPHKQRAADTENTRTVNAKNFRSVRKVA